MEIKATLNKPYTDSQRLDFIVNENHRNGYEIRETDVALEAWGADDEEKLEQAKQAKYNENEAIRDAFLVSGVEYKDILWDSDLEQKLNISVQLSNMNDEDTVVWVAMDGVTSLECTKEDLTNIGALLTIMTAYVWQFKNPAIKQAIANAETIEEVEAIEIVYDMNEPNEEAPAEEEPEVGETEEETTEEDPEVETTEEEPEVEEETTGETEEPEEESEVEEETTEETTEDVEEPEVEEETTEEEPEVEETTEETEE